MSKAICTGLTSSGNSFSEAKSSTFSPLPIVIFWIGFLAVEEDVRAVRPLAGLVGLARRSSGGVSESSTFEVRTPPRAIAQIAPVAVAGHHVEHRQLRAASTS